jgi:hypothetical protein
MGDEYNDFKRGFLFQKPKCKECKKRDRVPCPEERSRAILERLDARAKDPSALTRAEVDLLKVQRAHAEKVKKGDYCAICIEKIDLWVR